MTTRIASATQLLSAVVIACGVLGAPPLADARITRIEITRTEPAFDGAAFGDVGPYEKLVGRAFGEIDPGAPQSTSIADIALAPRNARGAVEYSTGIIILRPIDPRRGNRRLFYELTNRGAILSLHALNDSPNGSTTDPVAADAGNGFLMRQGYTMLFSGWDATATGTFSSSYPVAVQRDGSPIVGNSLEELIFDPLPPATAPTTASLTYPAASLDTARATLTVRTHYGDLQTPIPSTGWRFTDARTIQLLPEGTRFEPGRLYELAYPARDPMVAGLAFAAVHDLAVFLHHETADQTGAANPLGHRIDAVIAHGISQPARLLHDFVRLGWNRDDRGRRVFEGVLSYIAGASSGFFNQRFAQPTRTQRQHIGRWTPERVFPFADQTLYDPVTEQTGGRLARCTRNDTCPKIFEINSSNEYWVKGGSLLTTDTTGHDLLEDPPGVRYYHFASLPHGPASGRGICEQDRNPLAPNAGLRALLVDLDDWLSHRHEPPASRVPRRADHTLAPPLPQREVGFPQIPGVRYTGQMSTGDLYDFGSHFEDGIVDVDVRDQLVVSLVVESPYPVFVPTTDSDGNEAAGVRFPDVAVPLATYTGYGFRAAEFGGPDLCDAAGQRIPFAATRRERLASGDPRPSLEERYSSHRAYVERVRAAAQQLLRDRFLRSEDVDHIVEAADASDIGK
jgi:hypothetical protein